MESRVYSFISNNLSDYLEINRENTKTSILKGAIDLIKELSNPLYTEKERLKTIEMFYRGICQRRDY